MKKSRKGRRAGRGSVLLITTLFVSSGLIRLVSGMALAEDQSAVPLPIPEAVPPQELSSSALSQASGRAEMGSLLEALQAREAQLETQEHKMTLREKALQIAGEEIEKRLSELEQAEDNLRQTLSIADGIAENDLAQLTTVYESMKPKDAAALFEQMEPGFAAGFLGRMRPDIAASVMAGLTPEKAYSVSVILAGRNADVPKT